MHNRNLITNFTKSKKMSKLDLNAYGVEEMSVAEMREVEGGFIGGILSAIGNAIVDAAIAVWEWLVDNCRQPQW